MSLAINYFHHNREFFELNKYFWNNLEDKYKNHFHVNILTRECYKDYWDKELKNCNFAVQPFYFHNGFNYREKLQFCINQPEEYSIKMDEDCFVPTKSWEPILSNYELAGNDGVQLFTIQLSNGTPICDNFIEDFCNEEETHRIYNIFKNVKFDKFCNGINPYNDDSFLHLNKHTIDADKWNPQAFYEDVEKIPHSYKGIHPVRVSTEAQIEINKIILENIDKFLSGNDYTSEIMFAPYLCNGFFGIKTAKWKDILTRRLGDNAFDEIALNEERWENKEQVIIMPDWACHLFYNAAPESLNQERKKLENIYYKQLCVEIIGD